jgi:hypothetical protein
VIVQHFDVQSARIYLKFTIIEAGSCVVVVNVCFIKALLVVRYCNSTKQMEGLCAGSKEEQEESGVTRSVRTAGNIHQDPGYIHRSELCPASISSK